MKKFILSSAVIAIFLCVITVKAQEKLQLDNRAAKYYSPEKIAAMDEIKIKQLNYIYTKSFFIDNTLPNCKDCKECQSITPDMIDVNVYKAVRQQSKRVYVPYTTDKIYLDEKAMTHIRKKDGKTEPSKESSNPCKNIVLLSQDEINAAIKNIK